MPRFVRLASADQVRARGRLEVEWDGRVIALIDCGGEVRAIDGICPHQGGPLAEGDLAGTVLACPWHGWRFDLADGRCLTGPSIRQRTYAVRVEGGDVLVDVG